MRPPPASSTCRTAASTEACGEAGEGERSSHLGREGRGHSSLPTQHAQSVVSSTLCREHTCFPPNTWSVTSSCSTRRPSALSDSRDAALRAVA